MQVLRMCLTNSLYEKDSEGTVMTKKELQQQYSAKRQKMKDAVASLKATKDSKTKFERLIKITTDYESFITDLQLSGLTKATAYPYSSQKWIDAYYAFVNKPKAKPKAKKTDKNKKNKYNIILCWTIKPDYCVCESIIAKVKNYMSTIKLKCNDITRIDFPDRVEFCQTYELNCTKEKYDLIMKSAEYILELSTDSIYDKCNVGIFGKEQK